VVAAGLLLTAGWMFLEDLLRRQASAAGIDWRAFTLLVLALFVTLILLEPAGFILAAAVLFVLVARAFNSRKLLLDAILGTALSLCVYFAFTRGLGLVLPRGILAGLF
jgi:putative tricarboxylic transport membrane protein